MENKGLWEYIRNNIDLLKVAISDKTEAEVQEYFEALGFKVPFRRIADVVKDIYTGILNVSVREMTVIHAYGVPSFTPVEFNCTPLLESEIPLWLAENGYLTSEHKYLHEDANSRTGEYGWERYAVCWHTKADETYFVYVTRGMSHVANRSQEHARAYYDMPSV